jgi:hypothetical protein
MNNNENISSTESPIKKYYSEKESDYSKSHLI